MESVNWLRQGFNFLLSLRNAKPVITSNTVVETCLRQLLLFTRADEVLWIEKGSLFASSISSPEQTIARKVSFDYEDQYYLLGQKEVGISKRRLKRTTMLSEDKPIYFFTPVRGIRIKGCYILCYRSIWKINAEFIEFQEVCQQALTDLHDSLDARIRYEKLKIRFNGILKSLPHSIVFLEDEGSYCWVNENAAQLLGTASGTINPKLVHTAMADLRSRAGNAGEIEEKAEAAFKGKNVQQWNWIYHEPDFKVLQVRLQQVSTSNINGILWMWEDITKNYTYDQELQLVNKELAAKKEQAEEINRRYRFVGQATFDAIWDWDLEKGTLFWGKNYESIFGYDPGSLINHIDTWHERIHPEDAERVVKGLYQVIDGAGTNWADEYRYLKADGSFVHVADKAFMIRNDEGKATRAVGAMQDVTAHKKAEIRIKESEFNLRAIFESSIESFVLLDASNRVKAFNSRAKDYVRNIWGKELKAGENMLDYMDGSRRERFNNYLVDVRNGQSIEYDRAFKRTDQTVYWSHCTLTPVYHGSAVIGTCITERDVTDLKNHLETIESQNQTFRDISWTQSHLVRAPLANIMALTALLKSNSSGNDKDALLNHLETASQRLDAVIKRINTLTSSGKPEIAPTEQLDSLLKVK